MKKLVSIGIVLVVISLACLYFMGTDDRDASHLAWCDSIYHRNVSCPMYGQIKVPQEVLDQEEVDHLAWCDRTYHLNPSCPKHPS